MSLTHAQKLQALANLISQQSIERLKEDKLDCPTNVDNALATVKPGKKYTKIDRNRSGMLMVDAEGNIFGVKAYGVIHKGHYYGTLDTINNYYWGNYHPQPIRTPMGNGMTLLAEAK